MQQVIFDYTSQTEYLYTEGKNKINFKCVCLEHNHNGKFLKLHIIFSK